MITSDNINYDLSGCVVKVLTIHDVIKDTDFIRLLIQTGIEGGFATAFKPYKWNGMAWHAVTDDFPGWIGKRILGSHIIVTQLPEKSFFRSCTVVNDIK